MPKCKGCGQQIIFVRTEGEKSMPCDPAPVQYWAQKGGRERLVTPRGEVVACTTTPLMIEAAGIGYVPHFATCPVAAQFRKGR